MRACLGASLGHAWLKGQHGQVPLFERSYTQVGRCTRMTTSTFFKEFWLQWLRPALTMAAIVYPIKSSLADMNFVPTGSMKPTILEGDFVAVNKLAYDLKIPFTTQHLVEWADPARGDVVVLFSPKDAMRLVKRVVAVPGDTIELRNNVLFINGAPADYQLVPQEELPYITWLDREDAVFASEMVEERSHAVMAYPGLHAPQRSFRPITLGAREYFVMGDNRDNSEDSRYFGIVDRDLIVGRATAVVASFDKPGDWLPRVGRFFSPLK
jgi:signal peptidase I